jgi:hypothetical protein
MGLFYTRLEALRKNTKAGLDFAIAKGWLWKHESGTYLKFTQAGADCSPDERVFKTSESYRLAAL